MTEPVISEVVDVSPSGPADPFAAPPEAHAAPRKPWRDRRALRAAARWTLAVLVCGGLGTGTAYGITGMTRTDVPGLATQEDGRWTYPKLTLPALAAGAPRPYTDGNDGEIHHADLRRLLLPAPKGATVDKTLNGGWVSTDQYVGEYAKDKRAELKQALSDASVRHIAARGWTMPDGTTSRIYLLQFKSVAFATTYKDESLGVGYDGGKSLNEAPEARVDTYWTENGKVENNSAYVYVEPKPYGNRQVRQAYVLAGDTVALVFQSHKGATPRVPFTQTVILQNQLLG
ncbi:hypothetical protein [Streptomyces sp. NBC_01465]|uniref:hypothetical protein n=1 Tax=Streptomyces sp. NBC_01465 TaxID=2903878 RepID=UPI002E356B28|nr:hypothetical protein [Streptomyces sp. NBC_01465]